MLDKIRTDFEKNYGRSFYCKLIIFYSAFFSIEYFTINLTNNDKYEENGYHQKGAYQSHTII